LAANFCAKNESRVQSIRKTVSKDTQKSRREEDDDTEEDGASIDVVGEIQSGSPHQHCDLREKTSNPDKGK